MTSYLIMWLVVVLLGLMEIRIIGKDDKQVIFISKAFFPCMFLMVISGLRALCVGNDNRVYSTYFSRMSFGRIGLFNLKEFWIYNLFAYAIRMITDNVYIFNFLCAAIIYISVYWFIHKFSYDEHLSIILYFSLGLFFVSMNQTRQAIAIAILLWGFGFVMEKKIIPTLMLCFIAIFIHNISIVILPIYIFFIVVPRISQKTVLFISAFFVGLAIAYDRFIVLFVFLAPRYKEYLKISSLFVEKRSIYRYGDLILALLVQLTLIYIINQNTKENRYDELLCVIACMNAINVCMAYLVTNAEIIIRVKGIFSYWMILAIPHILARYFKDYKLLRILVAGTSLLYMLRLGVKDGDGVIPYMFFWQNT